MDLVGFLRNSSISSRKRWLFISFAPSMNSQDIEEYPERHLGNQSILSLFVPFEEKKDPKESIFLLVVESLFD
ncbi:hypothetical protein NC652_003487 [Populus alba x Populus x berolinensis]|nr:hypothetical protein NC652_003487 [Populus alba x Populus x berolinensis]